MLVIYHWEPNANSAKPIMTALEKGIPFESRYVNLTEFEQHSPEYLGVNPSGMLPSLVHDGVLIPESTVQAEYLDEAFPGPAMRPADPFERWRMRWWCRYLDQVLGPSVSQFGWHAFVIPSIRQQDPEQLRSRVARIPRQERRDAWYKAINGTFSAAELAESERRMGAGAMLLNEALAGRPWLAGASYSIADMAGWGMVAGLPLMKPEFANDSDTPHLMDWLRRIYQRPATRETLALGRTPLVRRYEYLERRP